MDNHTISEESYKNGYDKGYRDGQSTAIKSARPADNWIGVVSFKPVVGHAGIKVMKYAHVQCSRRLSLNGRNSKFCPDCGSPMSDPLEYIDEEEWLSKYVRKEDKTNSRTRARSGKISGAKPR